MRILIIDDDDGIRRVLRRVLERAGHDVTDLNPDESDAQAALAAGQHRAALLDFSGHPIRLWVAVARANGIRPIVVTGEADRARAMLADDNVPVLAKPFNRPDLIAILEDDNVNR